MVAVVPELVRFIWAIAPMGEPELTYRQDRRYAVICGALSERSVATSLSPTSPFAATAIMAAPR